MSVLLSNEEDKEYEEEYNDVNKTYKSIMCIITFDIIISNHLVTNEQHNEYLKEFINKIIHGVEINHPIKPNETLRCDFDEKLITPSFIPNNKCYKIKLMLFIRIEKNETNSEDIEKWINSLDKNIYNYFYQLSLSTPSFPISNLEIKNYEKEKLIHLGELIQSMIHFAKYENDPLFPLVNIVESFFDKTGNDLINLESQIYTPSKIHYKQIEKNEYKEYTEFTNFIKLNNPNEKINDNPNEKINENLNKNLNEKTKV
jgi:hypothetical protein